MLARTFIALALLSASASIAVVAQNGPDEEPVLRLRLQDPLTAAAITPQLRPRLGLDTKVQTAASLMPTITVQDSGRVGKFAFVSTAHPNVVIAVGATEDSSEIGRQIDRAMTDMAGAAPLFEQTHDTAPFIGLGLRTGSDRSGWALNASIGAGLLNTAENSRVFGDFKARQQTGYEAEARANLKLRYRF